MLPRMPYGFCSLLRSAARLTLTGGSPHATRFLPPCSGSLDRSIKLWSLDDMAYVDTLFGHQAGRAGVGLAGAPKGACVVCVHSCGHA